MTQSGFCWWLTEVYLFQWHYFMSYSGWIFLALCHLFGNFVYLSGDSIMAENSFHCSLCLICIVVQGLLQGFVGIMLWPGYQNFWWVLTSPWDEDSCENHHCFLEQHELFSFSHRMSHHTPSTVQEKKFSKSSWKRAMSHNVHNVVGWCCWALD